MAGKLIIRADAGPRTGAGHVMRCLALAQAWQDAGGSALFVTASQSAPPLERIKAEGIDIVGLTCTPGSDGDAAATSELARQSQADWVVVDGYHFGADYQKRIKECDLRELFLDDYGHARHYYADIVLNHNPGDWEPTYSSRETYTQLLLGSSYLLLRREFKRWRDVQREIPSQGRKLLVTLGGGDTRRLTVKVIRALDAVRVDGLEVTVVVGGDTRTDELDTMVANADFSIQLVRNAANMAQWMSWADAAVIGGGGTCWEAAFMGLPSLAVVLAGNQWAVVNPLAEAGALETLGWFEELQEDVVGGAVGRLLQEPERRVAMRRAGCAYVDEGGARRVVQVMKEMCS